jgi:hypothetical protein
MREAHGIKSRFFPLSRDDGSYGVVSRPLHPGSHRVRLSDRACRLAAIGAAAIAALPADRLRLPGRGTFPGPTGVGPAAASELSAHHRTLHRIRGYHRADGCRAETRPRVQLAALERDVAATCHHHASQYCRDHGSRHLGPGLLPADRIVAGCQSGADRSGSCGRRSGGTAEIGTGGRGQVRADLRGRPE